MIAWFVRNPVAANLLMLTIVLTGLGALQTRIPLEVFPSVEPQTAVVQVVLRGAHAEDVEAGITTRVEEAIADLEGIDRITSSSNEGSAVVRVEIDDRHDPREVLEDIKSRVDALSTLPADAERPMVSLAQRKREVITVAVSGPLTEKEIRQLAERVRDDLLAIDGITQVELDGVRSYEIAIEISEDVLRKYGLQLSQVAEAIRNNALDLSAGDLKSRGGDILLRAKAQAYTKDDYERIVVKATKEGGVVRLGDIARVSDGFEETPLASRFNGQRAAFVDVYRVGQQSAIAVADAVKAYVAEHQANMPQGVQLSYWRDRSEIVKNRLGTLTRNAIQGGVLVLALLTLFLRPAIAFWVFIGVPVSFMGAFLVMPFFDVSLNIISLFAFIVVLGIVVDDAIVTGENVYRHLKAGEDGRSAAIKGTEEVAIPVTFGVLTTIAAFIPIAFLGGWRGPLFAQLPVVIIPVLLFSLIESKFVLPSHLQTIRIRSSRSDSRWIGWQQAFANGFEAWTLKYYSPALRWSLNHRYAIWSTFLALLVVVSISFTHGWTRFVFFPRVESELARASLVMPVGTPFELTDTYVTQIEQAARRLQAKYIEPETGKPVIENIYSVTGSGDGGSSGAHIGRVMFEIVAPEKRTLPVTSSQLVKEWRALIGQIPGAETLTFRAEIGRVSDPIDVQLSSRDMRSMQAMAEEIKAYLGHFPTVFDVADSQSVGKRELRVTLTPAGERLGFSLASVVTQIRQAYFGLEVQRIQRGRDDVRVMLRWPESKRRSFGDLQTMELVSPTGQRALLAEVVQLQPDVSPVSIRHIDGRRTLNVTADVDKTRANMTVIQQDIEAFVEGLAARYPGVRFSLEGEAREQRDSFSSLGWGLIFVVFVLYGLLAIPFRSYVQPIIIMSVIPFGLMGAVAGHWIMGLDLSLSSLLGMLALMGVVVNDGLVLVDFINRHVRQGDSDSLHEAIGAAGVKRFRPVLLTSLTTFLGLMPLLFETSTQAQFLIPLAVSLGFGILFATVVNLLVVPCNYLILEDFRSLVRRSLRWLQG